MRSELEYINRHSNYVSVNIDMIKSFVNNMTKWEYSYWLEDLKSYLSERECIIFAFICQSINFCFWGSNSGNNYENYIGSEEMFNNLKMRIENDPSILSIERLMKLTKNEFMNLIGLEFKELLLLDERYKMLNDTISIIYSKGEAFYNEIFSIKSELELLNYIICNFWHFDDKSLYNGKIVRFDKRAILLVNDLYHLSNTIKNNIKSIDNLSGCADYVIPRLLYEYHILDYNEDLLEKISSNMLIEHNSLMEIEIRANTLYALELIKYELNKRNIQLSTVEIDNMIWKMRKNRNYSIPVHKTITIYY